MFGVTYNGKFYAGTSARDTRYSQYSVGHLHLRFLFQYAIDQGLGEFDFLKGDEAYKLYWTKTARGYQRVMVVAGACRREWRLRFLRSFFRAHDLRRFGMRESLRLRRLRKRAEAEHERMCPGSRA
jgi:CelD/BcsL family acetyltransferase involved in cellulose biosynthesis